jgi:uncharacterized integral membrane protein
VVEPRDDRGRERPERRRVSPKLVLALIVAGLAVILILQNTRDTQVNLLFWDVTAGLWTLLLGAVVLGMLLGWLLPKLRRGRRGDVEAED